MDTAGLFSFYLFHKVSSSPVKSLTMSSSSSLKLSSPRHQGKNAHGNRAAGLSSEGELICSKQPFIFSTQLLVSLH